MSIEHKPQTEEGGELREPSVERIKRELFVRDVPRADKDLIADARGGFVELNSGFAESLIYGIAKDSAARSAVDNALLTPKPFELTEDQLSDFGKELKRKVGAGVFFDLASSDQSWAAQYLPLLNAKLYIGVDINIEEERGYRKGQSEMYFLRDDILSFLSKLRNEYGGIFYISGLDPLQQRIVDGQRRCSKEIQEYHEAVLRELWRVMKNGDILIIGPKTIGFDFEKAGFVRITSLPGRVDYESTEVYTKP